MTKLAANLTMLFNEVAFLDRFEAAARAGFRGVEFLFPYAFHADQIADRLSRFQLDLVLHNLPAGKWEAGERGIACHPDRQPPRSFGGELTRRKLFAEPDVPLLDVECGGAFHQTIRRVFNPVQS